MLIVYYFNKFEAECPAKNGKNRRFFKTIFHFWDYSLCTVISLFIAELIKTEEEVRDLFGQSCIQATPLR